MFNKKCALYLAVSLLMIVFVSLTSCNKAETPYSLWSDAAVQIGASKTVSADIELKYGDNTILINSKRNNANNTKSLEIKFSEDDILKVYSDGSTNYYDNSNLKYSTSNSADNAIMKEFLSFKLLNEKTLGFSESFFSDAQLKTDGNTSFSVNSTGADIKAAIAPDEDISFSDATLYAEFDSSSKLCAITLSGKVSGKEFYGIPLCNAKNAEEAIDFSAKITNISYSDNEPSLIPENKSEYPDIPALAQLSSAIRMISLKGESAVSLEGNVKTQMMGINMEMPLNGKVTSAKNDGFTTTRSVMTVSFSLMGQTREEKTDTFTDGKSDYVYYTSDKAEDCYKILQEEDESNMSEISDMFKDPEKFGQYLKDAVITKSGKDTVIKLELTNEQISELIESISSESTAETADGDNDTDFGGSMPEFSDAGIKVEIVLSENGTISKFSVDFSASVESDESLGAIGQGNLSVTYGVSLKASMSDIYEDIVPDIPEGYENYPERTIDDDFEM